jgi:hypothetical protein
LKVVLTFISVVSSRFQKETSAVKVTVCTHDNHFVVGEYFFYLTRHVARMMTTKKAYELLVGKSLEKCPYGRPKIRCENSIKTDFRDMGLRVRRGCNWLGTVSNGDLWLISGVEPSGSCTALLVK